eukprot:16438673-Heterocapsa_arctica.AAC.1
MKPSSTAQSRRRSLQGRGVSMPTGPRARASHTHGEDRAHAREAVRPGGQRVSATSPPASNSAHNERTATTHIRKETQRAPAL